MSIQPYEKSREEWKDGKSGGTRILAENLNHIEQGIYDNSVNISKMANLSVKEVKVKNVEIKTRSASGLYYGTVGTLEEFGLKDVTVAGLMIIGWANISSLFNLYLSGGELSIKAMSNISQTLGELTFYILYFETGGVNP